MRTLCRAIAWPGPDGAHYSNAYPAGQTLGRGLQEMLASCRAGNLPTSSANRGQVFDPPGKRCCNAPNPAPAMQLPDTRFS